MLEYFDHQVEKLKLFYTKALPQKGWEKYQMISLKYENQIVASK
jgi:cell division protein FtsQ